MEVMRIDFRYVHTSENPADLISRGVFQGNFKMQFKFWLSGPFSLAGDHISLPVNKLN